ncbi:MAG: hypothetical protein ACOZBL_04145 [Patescibacteria group bacterium]
MSDGVLITASMSQVVRLSGRLSVLIVAFQFWSVVKFASQYAVSLNVHLFFFEFHHFRLSQSHHFSQCVMSFTSSLSIRSFSELYVSVPRYLFIS